MPGPHLRQHRRCLRDRRPRRWRLPFRQGPLQLPEGLPDRRQHHGRLHERSTRRRKLRRLARPLLLLRLRHGLARQKEEPWNSIFGGAGASGLLSMRHRLRWSGRSALVGGAILALIEGAGIMLNRYVASAPPPGTFCSSLGRRTQSSTSLRLASRACHRRHRSMSRSCPSLSLAALLGGLADCWGRRRTTWLQVTASF
jgi:hypothetical protein